MTSFETDKSRNTQRRDDLVLIQTAAQAKWARERVFEVDAPSSGDAPPKFFGNFPYPYMNGLLHLGHAFSLSKVEFASAYQRLCGKRALFPFAFHCTGMPIKAAADKIRRELFERDNPDTLLEHDESVAKKGVTMPGDVTGEGDAVEPATFKSKKSKATAKAAHAATQWEIMRLSGVPEEDIKLFADPKHWLVHFPPLGVRDVTALGCGVDWRRSFITTDANPYYDSFVRWQFNTLHARGYIVRDKRYAVFSPQDGQPCADHDRSSGEGVGPQEYTLIKLAVASESLVGALSPLAGRHVFLAAATLRPETMYGQTNCWVLPEGCYGAYEVAGGDVLVMTARAALNMSYQEGLSSPPSVPTPLLEITGFQLIGLQLRAPLSLHTTVYALPMLTILTTKGTGIVTSVPSDSPDDYMALCDLQAKPALREKYGVASEWVLPFAPVPVIHTTEFGNAAAPAVCALLKIRSQNDRMLLDEAKHLTYLKGFTDGVMLVGPHSGLPVREAKPLIRKALLASGDALSYSEPERQVISRSGDECVVALTDQWYLQYGEEKWRAVTQGALDSMDTKNDETRNQFNGTMGWLRQWACSRSFGLGSRVPWDPDFLIESLSDSTLYMAYYTVAHLLQKGDMYGQNGSVPAEFLTDDVWDSILLGKPLPANTPFPPELLLKMRAEFEYWYPFDLRVSGRDLIQNHLTFCLYNHTALLPARHWPRAMRCNGHLLLNGDKMSKSTGNFKTLAQAVAEYSADAVRVALADAGDGLDDANFEVATANAAVLRLTRELVWAGEVVDAASAGKLRTGILVFADRAFNADMDAVVHNASAAYESLAFRAALKAAYFDLHNARDAYRVLAGEAGLHSLCALRFVDLSARLLAPIAPHFAEHVWGNLLHKPGSVLTSGWPDAGQPDEILRAASTYLARTVVDWRKAIAKSAAHPKAKPLQRMRCASLDAYVATHFSGWRTACLDVLSKNYNAADNTFGPDGTILAALRSGALSHLADDKAVAKVAMPFIRYKQEEARCGGGEAVLQPALPFDEAKLLADNGDHVARALGLDAFRVHTLSDAAAVAAAPDAAKAASAEPGQPAIFLGFVLA